MKPLEILKPHTCAHGSVSQVVYVLNNGGARHKKFVCRLSDGEKLEDTIKAAKQYQQTANLNPSFSTYLNNCGQYR